MAALMTGAGVAAAQLGLGYGLGIIAWSAKTDPATSAGAWSAALVWTTWIAATSVIVGAVVGDRLGGPATGGWFGRSMSRLVTALAATLGALATIPLVAVPAQDAGVADNYAPHLLASIYAAAGVVLGLVVALIALAARAVAANVIATTGWLWVLATIAATDGAATDRRIGYAQLAVWKFTDQGPLWHGYYIPGALLMLGSALLIGGLAAFPAAGRGANRFGVAISGAAAPLLVAVAYILAAPTRPALRSSSPRRPRWPRTWCSPGLAGSVLVAAIGGVPARKSKPAPSSGRSKPAARGRPAHRRRARRIARPPPGRLPLASVGRLLRPGRPRLSQRPPSWREG